MIFLPGAGLSLQQLACCANAPHRAFLQTKRKLAPVCVA